MKVILFQAYKLIILFMVIPLQSVKLSKIMYLKNILLIFFMTTDEIVCFMLQS